MSFNAALEKEADSVCVRETEGERGRKRRENEEFHICAGSKAFRGFWSSELVSVYVGGGEL